MDTKEIMNTKEKAKALSTLHLLKQITKPTDKLAHSTHECIHEILYNTNTKK